jgi:uncharacterized protein
MPMSVEVLGPVHVSALKGLLARDVIHNMYLLGVVDEFGVVCRPDREAFHFYGHFNGSDLTAAVFVGGYGGLVIPSASALSDITDIAQFLVGKIQVQSALGEKNLVDGLLHRLGAHPKFSKIQRLFSVSADDLGPFTNPRLRRARDADVPRLIDMSASAQTELVQRNPLDEDAEGFALRIRQRVNGGRTYVLEEDGDLVLKLDLGSRSTFGAEIEGLYTIPRERNKGHATLCMGQISRFLLSSLPRLTVRVDDTSSHFTSIVRKVGFLPGRLQRLVWM